MRAGENSSILNDLLPSVKILRSEQGKVIQEKFGGENALISKFMSGFSPLKIKRF